MGRPCGGGRPDRGGDRSRGPSAPSRRGGDPRARGGPSHTTGRTPRPDARENALAACCDCGAVNDPLSAGGRPCLWQQRPGGIACMVLALVSNWPDRFLRRRPTGPRDKAEPHHDGVHLDTCRRQNRASHRACQRFSRSDWTRTFHFPGPRCPKSCKTGGGVRAAPAATGRIASPPDGRPRVSGWNGARCGQGEQAHPTGSQAAIGGVAAGQAAVTPTLPAGGMPSGRLSRRCG